jgi:flagellar protein FlaI
METKEQTQEEAVAEEDFSSVDRIPLELDEGEISPEIKEDVPEEGEKEKEKEKKKISRLVKRVKKLKEEPDKEKEEEESKAHIEEIDFIPIQEPFSYVKLTLNKITNEYVYNILEPTLSSREKRFHEFIVETLSRIVDYDHEFMSDKKTRNERLTKLLIEDFNDIISDYSLDLSEESLGKIKYYVIRDYVGYGRVDVIMNDPAVEDVSCDGPAIPVFIYHRELGSVKTNVDYENDEELESFVVSLAQRCGRTITIAEPVLDATLPDGSRLNTTLGHEVTTRGSSFTIRKFSADPLTMVDLTRFNTLSPEMGAHLWLACQYGESIISAGGTASGKTSTMNSIALFIPPSSKVISIEDTREINLPHENWIAGVTRGGAEAESEGDIDMYDLLRAALRQRPEYVLVGEVRGKETMTMFQAMATGHTTYSTMHADSVQSIVYRLENPPISIPRVLLSALNLVIIHNQLRVKGKRQRRVTELVEIIGIEPMTLEIITNKVFQWIPASDSFQYTGHSRLHEKIMELEDLTAEDVLREVRRRANIIRWMDKHDIRNFRDVSQIVAEYYENAEKIMKQVYKDLGLEPEEEEEEEEIPIEEEDEEGEDEEGFEDELLGDEPEPTEGGLPEDQPIDEPFEGGQFEDEPTEDEPTENEPTENEPTENEPTENEPTENEPTEDEPTEEPEEDSSFGM